MRAEPKAPLMAPFMAYLLLMLLDGIFPIAWQPLSIIIHMAATGWVVWVFRNHYPPWGSSRLVIGVIAGVIAAGLWVFGQHLFDRIPLGDHQLGDSLTVTWKAPFLTLVRPEALDPHSKYGDGFLFWSHVILKICRAVLLVPIVEELFWRGFLLRALVRWDWFDKVPWGSFSWRAFLGTSLLSVMQHPGNWGVSIVCWMLYNALFYWTKSLRCLMLTHAVTNLVLYVYVVRTGDWRFW